MPHWHFTFISLMKHAVIILLLISITFVASAQDIFQAARGGNVEQIKIAIEKGESVDASDARGFTPLILAVYNDQPDAVDFLIKEGATLAQADGSGNTALMGAVFKGNFNMVKKLVEAGADVNQRNLNDASALIFAATFGRVDIVEYLLAHKADKAIQDNRGKTALDHATMQENEAIIQLLK